MTANERRVGVKYRREIQFEPYGHVIGKNWALFSGVYKQPFRIGVSGNSRK